MMNDDGYTLIESLVAMALFVTVVLLLFGSIGTLMFSNSTASLQSALRIGETELSQSTAVLLTDATTTSGEFVIERHVTKKDRIAEVNVNVALRKQPGKILVALTKIVSLGE